MATKQTLLITKYIRKIIVENIKALNSRVYALDARTGTQLPFAVLIRDSVMTSSLTKDGLAEDTVGVSVYIVSRGYDDGVTIANDIRNLLDRTKYTTNDINIPLITFEGADETYTDTPSPAFIQQLRFNVKVGF